MDGLILEPYAAVLSWQLPAGKQITGALITTFIDKVAEECAAFDNTLIGHIKAIATFGEKEFFRISKVAPDIPASEEGEIPADCTSLDLTLNVHVYGIEKAKIGQIVREAAAASVSSPAVSADIEEMDLEENHSHHHHHRDHHE